MKKKKTKREEMRNSNAITVFIYVIFQRSAPTNENF